MNRKQFLRRLGIGAVAVVMAPKILAEIPEKKFAVKCLDAQRMYPMTYNECFRPAYIFSEIRYSGNIEKKCRSMIL